MKKCIVLLLIGMLLTTACSKKKEQDIEDEEVAVITTNASESPGTSTLTTTVQTTEMPEDTTTTEKTTDATTTTPTTTQKPITTKPEITTTPKATTKPVETTTSTLPITTKTPETTAQTTTTPKITTAPKSWVNTAGEGDYREAGAFRDGVFATVDKSLSFTENRNKLNGIIMKKYTRWYIGALTQNGSTEGIARFDYDEATDRYYITVFEWRKSLDSNIALNGSLNAVMESFYFLCGDKEVAYGLFSMLDKANIDGWAEFPDFGFKEIGKNGKNDLVSMNNVKIEVSYDGKKVNFYFE